MFSAGDMAMTKIIETGRAGFSQYPQGVRPPTSTLGGMKSKSPSSRRNSELYPDEKKAPIGA